MRILQTISSKIVVLVKKSKFSPINTMFSSKNHQYAILYSDWNIIHSDICHLKIFLTDVQIQLVCGRIPYVTLSYEIGYTNWKQSLKYRLFVKSWNIGQNSVVGQNVSSINRNYGQKMWLKNSKFWKKFWWSKYAYVYNFILWLEHSAQWYLPSEDLVNRFTDIVSSGGDAHSFSSNGNSIISSGKSTKPTGIAGSSWFATSVASFNVISWNSSMWPRSPSLSV